MALDYASIYVPGMAKNFEIASELDKMSGKLTWGLLELD